ncbi:MAG: putative peptide modification system cyclase, partial [Xanthomonadales bacterium]|nr:putative peptide modification system cyclase [Xanthomonadales bacterium]
FEVGEPGIAPLRAPPSSPKAWRDIPLWRRPAALAAEAAVVAVVAIGLWFFMRPQPAIAFNERDWVVLADLRNLTGEPLLDDSLEQAFRISLEQSRHVNVLSDLKTRDTLARMQREPDTELDRTIASGIAIRDGARAVILPTVAEVGGRVRVSAEVIDPHSQTTVYAEYADGKGAVSALRSIDSVTATLRYKLGEAMEAVARDSAPLPAVTTADLDALRAYALAQQAYAEARYGDAAQLFGRAIELDPQFALAYLGSVRAKVVAVNAEAAEADLRKAEELKNRLPPRDKLYLDAWIAEFSPGNAAQSKWKLLSQTYPDYFPGPANYAISLYDENKFAEALPYARAVTSAQNPLRAIGYNYVGRFELAQGNYGDARDALDQAIALGSRSSIRQYVDLEAVEEDFHSAESHLANILDGSGSGPSVAQIERVTLLVDTGRLGAAAAETTRLVKELDDEDESFKRVFELIDASVKALAGEKVEALRRLDDVNVRALDMMKKGYGYDGADVAYIAWSSAYLAQREGDTSIAKRTEAAFFGHPESLEVPRVAKMKDLVEAGNFRLQGRPKEAIERLRVLVDGNELFQTHVALLDAYTADGQFEEALAEASWLRDQRGLAYIEQAGGQSLQAINVADTRLAMLSAAEAWASMDNHVEARKEALAFTSAWHPDGLPDHLRLRVEAIIPASKQ